MQFFPVAAFIIMMLFLILLHREIIKKQTHFAACYCRQYTQSGGRGQAGACLLPRQGLSSGLRAVMCPISQGPDPWEARTATPLHWQFLPRGLSSRVPLYNNINAIIHLNMAKFNSYVRFKLIIASLNDVSTTEIIQYREDGEAIMNVEINFIDCILLCTKA
jgi:hypothetical protein